MIIFTTSIRELTHKTNQLNYLVEGLSTTFPASLYNFEDLNNSPVELFTSDLVRKNPKSILLVMILKMNADTWHKMHNLNYFLNCYNKAYVKKKSKLLVVVFDRYNPSPSYSQSLLSAWE